MFVSDVTCIVTDVGTGVFTGGITGVFTGGVTGVFTGGVTGVAENLSETKSNFASFASDCTSRIGCRISSLCTTSRCCSLSLNSLRISSSLLTAFTLRSFFCSCCC